MLSIINEDLVLIQEKRSAKSEVLKSMVNLLHKSGRVTDSEKLYKQVMEREKIQSTGIGEQIAIPHAKSDCVNIISVAICICKTGIEFDSWDKKPVRLVFLIAAPATMTKTYLQIIAKIARILKTRDWREKFTTCDKPKEVIKVLENFDEAYPDRLKIEISENGRALLR
ncbi:MAG: PTS sugar transporter subunit IIA [Spirochaetes bacterium]|nr:PTS sugar transporter subunit IIA [Spirochaetota bacterium]